MKHVNIPVFVPHLGCPKQCVFCDQRAISGVRSFDEGEARRVIERHLATLGDAEAEIAFFGGSFTGIGRERMTALLELAEEYVRAGPVRGIRFSTRPDFIDGEILEILSRYTITAAELGIQSSSDRVLALSKRGHTAEDSRRAMELLAEAGIPLVGQMMLGLPGAEAEDDRETARFIADCGASFARIYPTAVFRSTELYAMTLRGEYRPLSEEEAVERGADVLGIFAQRGVEVIRIGLPEGAGEEEFFAGPRHPAMGERIRSALYGRILGKACEAAGIPEKGDGAPVTLTVRTAPGECSAAAGYGRENKIRIENKYNVKKVKFIENPMVSRYNITLSSLSCSAEGGKPSCI